MKQNINEIKRMQQLAGLITENQGIAEAPASMASAVSKLYDKMLNSGETFDIDDEAVDDVMERIIAKVGHTPEQTKKKGAYKFAFGEHPQFETLTDQQLQAIVPFLKAVIKQGEFDIWNDWDGKQITDEDNVGEEDDDY